MTDIAEQMRDTGLKMSKWPQWKAESALMRQGADEISRLTAVLNTPELHDFAAAVALEAAHQRERWPDGHDACKTTADWIQLCVYLLGKSVNADWEGDVEKLKHHIITTGAALNNFHSQILARKSGSKGPSP